MSGKERPVAKRSQSSTATSRKPSGASDQQKKVSRGRPSTWGRSFEELKSVMLEEYPIGGYVKTKGWKNATLAGWVERQRYQHRRNEIKKEKIEALESIGFLWEDDSSDRPQSPRRKKKTSIEQRSKASPKKISSTSRNKSKMEEKWDTQFNSLAEYMKTHHPNGGYVVPSRCEPKLANWVQRQRGLYRLRDQGKITSLTDDRIERLESIGFRWTNNSESNEAMQVSQAEESDEDKSNINISRPRVLDVVEPATSDEDATEEEAAAAEAHSATRAMDSEDSEDDDSRNKAPEEVAVEDNEDSQAEGSSDTEDESQQFFTRKRNRKPATAPRARNWKRYKQDDTSDDDDDESESEDSEDSRPRSKRRRFSEATDETTINDSSLHEDLMKQNLPRLLSNQLDHLEYVKKKNSHLKSRLKEFEEKEEYWLAQKHHLEQRVQTLEATRMEERDRFQHERRRRKHTERQLKKVKKRLSNDIDEE